ncbi:MAG: AI-2E family transporter [Gemmatimonadales bacterium]|jgi:predicted PurR-regulated permease PerM
MTEPSVPPARTPWPSSRTVLATVAVIFLLYFGHAFFVPIAIALLFNILFRPLVRWLERRGVGAPIGATLVVILALVGLGAAGMGLTVPVKTWISKAPESMTAARDRLARFRKPVQQLDSAAAQLQSGGQTASRGKGQAAAPPAPSPASASPLLGRVLGTTTSLVATAVEVVLLLWLLLASGDLFYEKMMRVLPVPDDRRAAAKVANDTETAVAGYLVATALINLGQAVAVGLAMWLIGMRDPVLWAVLTFALEFIPYLGGAVNVGLLAIVAFSTFHGIWQILAAPGSYLLITTLQNNLVSPVVYGKRLQLNPVAVLVGVLFWWTLWGVPGAFLAVPIIATAKVLGDHLPRLRPLGEFLGG